MSGRFDSRQFEREAADRPATIARAKSLFEAAAAARSQSLAASYYRGAEQLVKRHSITDEELKS